MTGGLLGQETNWRVRSSRLLGIVDACVITWAVVGAFVLRFAAEREPTVNGNETAYVWISPLLIIVWWGMLGAWNSRQSRILGAGPEEYKRVAAASLWLFGLIAIFSYVFRIDTARGYVGIALPVGLGGLLLARWLVRQHLNVNRKNGNSMYRLMLVGVPGPLRILPHRY
jgi:FlaA1/EpsC-like NDP-sugar epimerase